jgi:hypothetical protein
MSVVRVDALCECEGCQKRFGIELDIGRDLGKGFFADFDAVTREEIRNGLNCGYRWGVRGKMTVERYPLSGSATIQAELMLCDECTRKCDDLPIEGNLTRAQVNRALGLAEDVT